jgi:ABC-type antimicrobial peptide transport system permease subunit
MPLAYAFKHMFRSWKLFLALLIGITLASTFFAGTDIKANETAKQALDQQLSSIPVDMTAIIEGTNLNLSQLTAATEKILDIEGVADAEIISSARGEIMLVDENDSVKQYSVKTIGIANDSRIFDGWLNRPLEIGENETYILEDSLLASEVKINQTIQVNFTVYISSEWRSVPINLTVKGLAKLDDEAYSIVHAIAYGYYYSIPPFAENLQFVGDTGILMMDLEKTMWKIFEAAYKLNPLGRLSEAATRILIYLDRDALIAPWDISTSINNIRNLRGQIEFETAELGLYVDVQNNLEWTLTRFQFESMTIRFTFTLVSLPIFFMAWYMGTTVSDVSYNLRRREIGLLSTKGFSRRQLLTTFLTETLLIGIIGSTLGVILGFVLNPLFTQLSAKAFLNPQVISPYTIIFTVAFGIIIAFLSTFSSARKASQLKTVDALREYLPIEMEKPYKKKWPWVALILGTYKIAVFILGVNMTLMLTRIAFEGGNFILMLLIGIWLILDGILNYIGPLLFFWGFTKLFIQGSLEFQKLTAKAARFLGDLSVLATRNVRRNPARSAAIAFLIALIVGYGVQVTGQLASEQDYTFRRIYYQVGSDVAIYVPSANDAPNILDDVMANVSENVQNATIEHSFSTYSIRGLGYLALKAVEPNSWLKTAYYENEWFSGNDVITAFDRLATENHTIILERRIAKPLKIEINEYVTFYFGSLTEKLKVVGFFGPEPPEQQQPVMVQQDFLQYWSFISEKSYKEISDQVSASAKILLKLKGDADEKNVAESIRSLPLTISSVESFAENLEKEQSNVITMGVLDVQRLGIVFAILAASVGTALVSAVSMKERSREAAIMSVKGLSYKQLLIVFLTENFALVVFSVFLGIIVGLIVTHGNICATNASILSIIQHRLVFPLDTTLLLTSCITLIFTSTILPILIVLRRYMTRLERMVRLR